MNLTYDVQLFVGKIAVFFVLTLSVILPASALWGFSPVVAAEVVIKTFIKHPKALPDDEIRELAEIAKNAGGTKIVGQRLGKLNLPGEVLEDAYIRIAVHQSTLTRAEAERMIARLRGVPGFRSTISKIIGASEVKTLGHLNELRIADSASKFGFKVEGIGVRFNDGRKAADTDIDVLLKKGEKVIAVEAKDYQSSTMVPLDKFRADMASLEVYGKQNSPTKVIKVFSITNRPGNELDVRILEKEATKHGVELIYGTPEQQIIQIQQLERIL